MNQVPKMLSGKDVMYICDILNVSKAYIKKFREYQNMVIDEKIKAELNKSEILLHNQFNSLLEVLRSEQ